MDDSDNIKGLQQQQKQQQNSSSTIRAKCNGFSVGLVVFVCIFLLANILTLSLVTSGVVIPYLQEITAYLKNEKSRDQYGGSSDEYCVYFTQGMEEDENMGEWAHGSLTWQFGGTKKYALEDRWISIFPTFWYDPVLYGQDAPDGYYIFGIYDDTYGDFTPGVESDTGVNTTYPNIQQFFMLNTTSGEKSEICMHLKENDLSPYVWYEAGYWDTCNTSQYLDLDYYSGYDDFTELLYQMISPNRYVTSDVDTIPNIEPGHPLKVMMVEYTPDLELAWWKTRSVDFFKKSQVCTGSSLPTRRTKLVTTLIADTGYNINVILTLNYLFLLLLFRKKQPVKSRLPLLAVNAAAVYAASFFVILLQVIVQGKTYMGASNRNVGSRKTQKSLGTLNTVLLISQSVQEILAAFCMLIYSLHIARYYYLKSLYAFIARKQKIQSSDFIIHRRLTSNIAFAIYSTIILIIILAIFVPLTVTRHVVGYDSTDVLVLKIIVYIIRSVVLVIIATCFCLDVLTNIKTLFQKGVKGIWWFFGYSDPLYFRIEMLLFTFIWFLIHPAFGINMQITYWKNNPFIVDPFSAFFTRGGIASEILFQIYSNFYLNFLICGGAICVIQILVLLRSRRNSNKKGQGGTVSSNKNLGDDGESGYEVESLLEDPEGFKLLDSFAEKEWSTENVRCWQSLIEFKRKGESDAEHVKYIYNTFVRKGSNLEVNIPGKTRAALVEILGASTEKVVTSMPFTIYLDLYRQVLTNITDTYSRLIHTDEYDQFIIKAQLMKNAMNEYM